MENFSDYVCKNIIKVGNVLNQYVDPNDSNYEDYYQDGVIRLMKVIKDYLININKGNKYKTPLNTYIIIRLHDFYKRYFVHEYAKMNVKIEDIDNLRDVSYNNWDIINTKVCLEEAVSSIEVPIMREVINRYFSNENTGGNLKAVSRELGITYEAARRYYDGGLRRLRHPSRIALFRIN